MGGSRRVPLPKALATRARSKTAARGGTTKAAKAAATRTVGAAVAVAATYVYCVVRGAERPVETLTAAIEPLPGGGAPRVLPLAPDTWLVVANVPLKAFGQEALHKRLPDVEWMSRCGAAHQAVMDAFIDSHAVVPMTLFTIFANDERALAEARKDAARLDASLDRVAGRAEWVVRVLRGDAVPEASAPTGARPGPTPRSGREFLQAKVDRRQAVRRAAEETGHAVRALMTALSDAADDVSDRTEAQTAGALRSTALLDAAFLVARTAEHQFEQVARRAAQPLIDRGFRVSVTGPWPCYSFVASASPAARVSP